MKNYWLLRVSYPNVYQDGTVIWERKNGQKHRNGDDPACEFYDGARQWFKNGRLHRENAPACIYPDGTTEWWLDGKRHRENDLPAIEYANNVKEYWKQGKRYYP